MYLNVCKLIDKMVYFTYIHFMAIHYVRLQVLYRAILINSEHQDVTLSLIRGRNVIINIGGKYYVHAWSMLLLYKINVFHTTVKPICMFVMRGFNILSLTTKPSHGGK